MHTFSNWISPAMLIKLAGDLEENDEEDDTDNVYEEIIPKERNVGNSYSIVNRGQTDQTKMYRLGEPENDKVIKMLEK